eukprot:TRINITY_DN55543_c0_g1_i1.p1 TRINITY_DN55543_c0_g1~~TRINITY_DN55543_c0_g1_i1.p1  ORF type:complete len:693 (+),score=137.30 TRINITY_DN55543_c0_g1_i1:76-2154(+)
MAEHPDVSTPSPSSKRPRLAATVEKEHAKSHADVPVAQQHLFLDKARDRDWPAVRRLIAKTPALVNVQPSKRWTALHQAAEAGEEEMVAFLLAQGADDTCVTRDGRTAREVASTPAVRALFLSHASVPAVKFSAKNGRLEFVRTTATKSTACSSAVSVASIAQEPVAAPEQMDTGFSPLPPLKGVESKAVYQLQSAGLDGAWVDMSSEWQALLSDAAAACINKALFREGGCSYVVDLVTLSQKNLATGDVCNIRLRKCEELSGLTAETETEVAPQDSGKSCSSVAETEQIADEAVPAPESAHEAVPASESLECTAAAGVERIAAGESAIVPGSGSASYTLKNCGDGVWSCSCVAWKMQGKLSVELRSCKHLAAFRGAAAEASRVGKGFSSGAAHAPSKGGSSKRKTPPGAASGAASSDAKTPPDVLLANKWDEKVDPTGWWISEKLDGMRAYWDPESCSLISRLGNPILCPKEFLASLPRVHLDGELFLGRGRFQELMSTVKNSANVDKVDGPWKHVDYIVFDLPAHAGKFEERQKILRSVLGAGPAGTRQFAQAHPQQLCRDRAHLDEELKAVQAKDGEGLMLRRAGSLYEKGRSNSLLKVKTFQDEEAVVVEHEPGKGRNVGVLGALRCRNREGMIFCVGTGFNDAQRADPPKVGEIITYRFFELTKDRKPRFPSFVGVRADADRTGLVL